MVSLCPTGLQRSVRDSGTRLMRSDAVETRLTDEDILTRLCKTFRGAAQGLLRGLLLAHFQSPLCATTFVLQFMHFQAGDLNA